MPFLCSASAPDSEHSNDLIPPGVSSKEAALAPSAIPIAAKEHQGERNFADEKILFSILVPEKIETPRLLLRVGVRLQPRNQA